MKTILTKIFSGFIVAANALVIFIFISMPEATNAFPIPWQNMVYRILMIAICLCSLVHAVRKLTIR